MIKSIIIYCPKIGTSYLANASLPFEDLQQKPRWIAFLLWLCCFYMKIKRKILWDLRYDGLLKAVALSLFYKNKYKSSTIVNFNYNKIHKETGLHITTIKKRIEILKRNGYVNISNGHIVFLSLSSKNQKRNVNVLCDNLTVKEIEKSLYASMIIEIQKHKDFSKHIIQIAFNPSQYTKLEDVKKARRLCYKYGYDRKFGYREFGLSYKKIAKKLCISLQKAFDIVKFSIENNLLSKTKRIKQVFIKGIGKVEKYISDFNYTFITTNNAYKVYANTYTIIE